MSIKTADTEDDNTLVTALAAFAQSKVSLLIQLYSFINHGGDMNFTIVTFPHEQKAALFEYGIRRITFLIAQKVKNNNYVLSFYPVYKPCVVWKILA